jgi:hypothetical protein
VPPTCVCDMVQEVAHMAEGAWLFDGAEFDGEEEESSDGPIKGATDQSKGLAVRPFHRVGVVQVFRNDWRSAQPHRTLPWSRLRDMISAGNGAGMALLQTPFVRRQPCLPLTGEMASLSPAVSTECMCYCNHSP